MDFLGVDHIPKSGQILDCKGERHFSTVVSAPNLPKETKKQPSPLGGLSPSPKHQRKQRLKPQGLSLSRAPAQVGALLGGCAFYALSAIPGSTALAVEPYRPGAEAMRRTAEQNGLRERLTVVEAYVSNKKEARAVLGSFCCCFFGVFGDCFGRNIMNSILFGVCRFVPDVQFVAGNGISNFGLKRGVGICCFDRVALRPEVGVLKQISKSAEI